ncbi:leech-derived tryptase inhibitor C-like [Lucilia cuprina]|uniref:leech-derived tryptase inhibitor C-like n=1 Tax=Lucilia cuprina TaxID=7375 RepID=UPI000C71BDAF|nr:leech-derived tryptase inhibitor C-like [Lucilia cuprina]
MKFFAVFSILLLAILAFAMADIASTDDLAESTCMCPRILEPVCGDDFVTYPNSCEFSCAQSKMALKGRTIAIAHPGSC